MELDLFDYDLPREMIAQSKSDPRDSSRLFYIDARSEHQVHEHLLFRDIIEKLEQGDLLVLNRTRVIPARIPVKKETGGKGEVLLLEREGACNWEALISGRNIKNGSMLLTEDGSVSIKVNNRLSEGRCSISFHRNGNKIDHGQTMSWLKDHGLMPTPPYIKKMLKDPEEYQTVYGDIEGSVAAPTAGLHFTDELMDMIQQKGIKILYITLHVGLGTFAPVRSHSIEDHVMEVEQFHISRDVSSEIADAVDEFRRTGKRKIWAVGTTVMRTLESAFNKQGALINESGRTGLYITPSHEFHLPYKGFITNFHLPRSTPLILVSSFYNREKVLEAYEEAKKVGYRFYSLGDSMMIRRG
jgi:S-adenosylmethionine:tRNA ribosyltransferase-isomerase